MKSSQIVALLLALFISLTACSNTQGPTSSSSVTEGTDTKSDENSNTSSISTGPRAIGAINISPFRILKTGYCPYITFSPDGQVLACLGGSKIQLWNVNSGQLLKSINWGKEDFPQSTGIVFSPDGKFLALGEYSSGAEIRDVDSGRLVYTFPHEYITQIAFSPDGQLLVTASSSGKVWDLRTGNLLRTENWQGEKRSAAIIAGWKYERYLSYGSYGQPNELLSPNGILKATIIKADDVTDNGDQIKLIRTGDGSVLHTFRLLPRSFYRLQDTAFGFSPDGTLLAAVSDGQTLDFYVGAENNISRGLPWRAYVWRTSDGHQLLSLKDSQIGGEKQLSFSPDGMSFAISIGNKSMVRLWRISYE
jgi:WD40 repeat protein